MSLRKEVSDSENDGESDKGSRRQLNREKKSKDNESEISMLPSPPRVVAGADQTLCCLVSTMIVWIPAHVL